MKRYPWPDRVREELVDLFDAVADEARAHGIVIVPYFGYRDEEQQSALFAQGRQPLGEVNALRTAAGMPPVTEEQNRRKVTYAKYGESAHTVDPCCGVDFYVKNQATGEAMWWEGVDLNEDGESDYHQVGEIAERMGLTWGGRWRMKDLGHLELKNWRALGGKS